jgi:hypothetical protein
MLGELVAGLVDPGGGFARNYSPENKLGTNRRTLSPRGDPQVPAPASAAVHLP